MFETTPVGLPALIIFGFGGIAGIAAFVVARWGTRAPGGSGGRRDRRSIIWIIAQGLAIGLVGLSGPRIALAPGSAMAILQGAAVLLLMASAVGLFFWAARTMGHNWALVAQTRENATLATDGPFRYIRNPIYAAMGLFMMAMAVALGHLAALIVALPAYVAATLMRVRSEERLLRAQFGTAYDEYAARVSRLIPGLI